MAELHEREQELQFYGYSPEYIAQQLASLRQQEQVEIWPEHHQAWQVFVRCSTDWRLTDAGPLGLDGNVILGVITLTQAAQPLQVFDQVKLIEQGALQHFAETKR